MNASATPARQSSGARLNRARVLDAGVALADRDGIEALSMRRLATELEVVPMALYKHVSDKDDLVAGMIDAVVIGYREPPPGLDWRGAVRERVLAAREALREHPWLRSAIERATTRTPAVLGYMNALAGEFARGGLSYDLAHFAMHALGHRIWGFSPEAFSSTGAAASPTTPPAAPPDPDAIAAMALQFPHVVAIALDAAERNPTGACDEDDEFLFTLDLLLDAVERLHRARWQSRPAQGSSPRGDL